MSLDVRPPARTMRPSRSIIASTIESLLACRAGDATICPSEVARALGSAELPWRSLMNEVRSVAADLVQAGRLTVRQKGRDIDPATARGPIRLGRPRRV